MPERQGYAGILVSHAGTQADEQKRLTPVPAATAARSISPVESCADESKKEDKQYTAGWVSADKLWQRWASPAAVSMRQKVSPVPMQMWQGGPSPGADVAGGGESNVSGRRPDRPTPSWRLRRYT